MDRTSTANRKILKKYFVYSILESLKTFFIFTMKKNFLKMFYFFLKIELLSYFIKESKKIETAAHFRRNLYLP